MESGCLNCSKFWIYVLDALIVLFTGLELISILVFEIWPYLINYPLWNVLTAACRQKQLSTYFPHKHNYRSIGLELIGALLNLHTHYTHTDVKTVNINSSCYILTLHTHKLIPTMHDNNSVKTVQIIYGCLVTWSHRDVKAVQASTACPVEQCRYTVPAWWHDLTAMWKQCRL